MKKTNIMIIGLIAAFAMIFAACSTAVDDNSNGLDINIASDDGASVGDNTENGAQEQISEVIDSELIVEDDVEIGSLI